MYEHILTDELWMGVVGILECTFPLSHPLLDLTPGSS